MAASSGRSSHDRLKRACRLLKLGAVAGALPIAGPDSSALGQSAVGSGDSSRDNTAAVRNVQQAVDQLRGTYCAEYGEVFIDVSATVGTFDIKIRGIEGRAYVTLSFSMTAAEVVAAINEFISWTGVRAEISAANQARVSVRPYEPGEDRYVSVTQYGNSPPIVYAAAVGGTGVYQRTDYACSFGVPACAEPATLYLQTGYNLNNGPENVGSTTLLVTAVGGHQVFTFASGSSQTNIIGALNTFDDWIGIEAEQCPQNPERIAVRSRLVGDNGYVSVQQVGGTPPIVVSEPDGGTLVYGVLSLGRSGLVGDVNCDRVVNVLDVSGMIGQWGACPHTEPSCSGDMNGDGLVNIDDLLRIINNWGATG